MAFRGETDLSPWTSHLTFLSLYSQMRSLLHLPPPVWGP